MASSGPAALCLVNKSTEITAIGYEPLRRAKTAEFSRRCLRSLSTFNYGLHGHQEWRSERELRPQKRDDRRTACRKEKQNGGYVASLVLRLGCLNDCREVSVAGLR